MKAVGFLPVILLLLLFAGQFTILVEANPWIGSDWISPKSDTKPPIFIIFSPQEDRIINSSITLLNFTSIVGQSKATYTWLMQVYYKLDWQENETYVYDNTNSGQPYNPKGITKFSYNLSLTEVPEGKHVITFHAVEWGSHINGLYYEMFTINGSYSVNFIVDTVSPNVSILSVENKTYYNTDLPLNFAVNESISKISCILDGQENLTIVGNSTLSNLAVGKHNITIYAWDKAGNLGTSKTITFAVAIPESPLTIFVTASITTIAIVGIGILVYLKKYHKRIANK